jgi:hypothetical protein
MLLELHLQRHNDPGDEYCLDLHTAYVFGYDIKDMRALIHFNLTECVALHRNRMGQSDEWLCYPRFLPLKR